MQFFDEEPTIEQYIDGNYPRGWDEVFSDYDFSEISDVVAKNPNRIFPPVSKVFRAYETISPNEVKVVLLAMDPYHNPGSATGLCFDVGKGNRINPSLRNIYKEIESEGFKLERKDGNLSHWAKQGVLMINASLTVKQGNAGSHTHLWVKFTEKAIRYISSNQKGLIFVLWGNDAKSFKVDIKNKGDHLILESSHPSPFSARKGFFGNGHFKSINDYLKENRKREIKW